MVNFFSIASGDTLSYYSIYYECGQAQDKNLKTWDCPLYNLH